MDMTSDLAERDRRLKQLRTAMEHHGLDGMIIAGHASQFNRGFIRYVTDAHMWAGDSLVLLPLESEPVHVQVTYASAAIPSKGALQLVAPQDRWVSDFRRAPHPQTEIIEAMKSKNLVEGKIGIVGLEKIATINAFEALREAFPKIDYVRADSIMERIRAIKSDVEIVQLRDVWKLAEKAIERFSEVVRPGISQREAVAEAIKVVRAGGAFDDLTLIHEGDYKGLPLDIPLTCNDMVDFHLEICGESGHWAEVNIICAFREPDQLERKLMETELRAFAEIRKEAKPGITLTELTAIFDQSLTDDGWDLGEKAWHFYFHGQGMDAIEWPFYTPMIEGNRDTTLEAGMVFSYHPHRDTLPGVMRIPAIYDGLLITANGAERLNDHLDIDWRVKT